MRQRVRYYCFSMRGYPQKRPRRDKLRRMRRGYAIDEESLVTTHHRVRRSVKIVRSFIAFLLAIACVIAPKPEVAVSSAIIDHLTPPTTIAATDVENLPYVVDATYRLRPDR